MQSILTHLAAGALGAALVLGSGFLVRGQRTGDADATAARDALHAACERLTTQVERLVASAPALAAAAPPSGVDAPGLRVSRTTPAPAAPAREAARSSERAEGLNRVRLEADRHGMLPEPDTRAIEAVPRDWWDSSETSRAWLFLSEREVLRRLGTPNQVNMHDNGESWVYRMEDDEVSDLHITFSRGRIIRMD